MGDDAGDSGRPEEARGEAPQARGGRGARPAAVTAAADPHRSTRMVLLLALLSVSLWALVESRRPVAPREEEHKTVRLEPREEVVEHAGKGLRVVYDLPYNYRPAIAPEELAMDLFIPESAQDCPVLVYLHGGGWIGGNKNGIGPKALYFASRGILVASVNYRLCPPRPQNHGAIDVADAIGYLHRQISAYGGDANRIFVMGHSAGAHLGALAICDASLLAGKDPAAAKAIRGAILLDGSAYDVPALMGMKTEIDFTQFFGTDSADWGPLSPCQHALRRTGLPPMMLVHAGEEPGRKMAAEHLARAVRAGGSAALLVPMPGRDHYSLDGQIGEKDDPLTPMIERFIERDGRME